MDGLSSSDEPEDAVDPDAADPIVKEYPVLLSKALGDKLYMLQHSTCPSYRNVHEVAAARIRPQHKVLEIVHHIKKDTHYDEHAPPLQRIKTFVHKSERAVSKANYVVGVFRDGKLVCTPLTNILRMAPSFSYIDSFDAATEASRAAAAAVRGSAGDNASDVKSEPTAVSVNLKVERPRFRPVSTRVSFAQNQRQLEDDAWVALKVCNNDADESYEDFESLCEPPSATAADNYDELLAPTSNSAYLAQLSANEASVAMKQENSSKTQKFIRPGTRLDTQTLRQMAPRERVSAIMSHGRLLHFHQVKQLVLSAQDESLAPGQAVEGKDGDTNPGEEGNNAEGTKVADGMIAVAEEAKGSKGAMPTDLQLVEMLAAVAVLVCGVWVLRSDLACASDPTLPAAAGDHRTSAAALAAYEADCRDLILSTFERSGNLRIRREDLDMSRTTCVMRPHRLKRQLEELAHLLQPEREWQLKLDADEDFIFDFPGLNTRGRNKWISQGDALRRRLAAVVAKGLPVISRARKGKRAGSRASRRSAQSSKAKGPSREAVVAKMKDPQAGTALTTLDKAMRNLLTDMGVVCTTQFLADELGRVPALQAMLTPTRIQKALDRVAMKIPSRDLFVIRRRGDDTLDELRTLVCLLYGKTKQLRRADVRKATKETFGPDSTHTAGSRYPKVIKEFATSQGSRWNLRSGTPSD